MDIVHLRLEIFSSCQQNTSDFLTNRCHSNLNLVISNFFTRFWVICFTCDYFFSDYFVYHTDRSLSSSYHTLRLQDDHHIQRRQAPDQNPQIQDNRSNPIPTEPTNEVQKPLNKVYNYNMTKIKYVKISHYFFFVVDHYKRQITKYVSKLHYSGCV